MWTQVLSLLGMLLGTGAQYWGDPYCEEGRDVIVHLFEWKWSDIEDECPWLAERGYCGVQVSPPQEHVIIEDFDPPYPWWQRYQPVSYQLTSRSGDRAAFQSMVNACNSVGVFIHVDAVVGHMTGDGSGVGSGGSMWDGDNQEYPGVPYSEPDFHRRAPEECTSDSGNIEDYGDAQQLRFCRLYGLRDLRTGSESVRRELTTYMNDLIDMGVTGFRLDAAKHILPADLAAIYIQLHDLNDRFPPGTRPFIYQEVIDLGTDGVRWDEYDDLAKVMEFRYSASIGPVFRGWDQQLSNLRTFGEAWGFMPSSTAFTFVDNHDNQRGHGPGGEGILNYKDAKLYKMATAFELAWDYGMPQVMSSYIFDNTEAGPPSDSNGNINDVICFFEWVCEHRWKQIYNMVNFHNVIDGEPLQEWWDNGKDAIAFSRGSKGFIAINNEDFTEHFAVRTSVPDGQYCNVYLCDQNLPPCSGDTGCGAVTVAGGEVDISIPNGENPVVAIHV